MQANIHCILCKASGPEFGCMIEGKRADRGQALLMMRWESNGLQCVQI